MTRILAMSDLHVDFKDNMQHMLSLSDCDYKDDCLIVAGDACDDMMKLEQLLASLKTKFSEVTFVPGNHELWVRRNTFANSLEKFHKILELCDLLSVRTQPFQVKGAANEVNIVPLFSWYRTDDNDPHSLRIRKVGEDWENSPWADKHYCKWPAQWQSEPSREADYFAELNADNIRQYDSPVISVSHFLPRRELIFQEQQHVDRFCHDDALIPAFDSDPAPSFNFSRVAGCSVIDQQIRSLGSTMHVYGHQHRNRNRIIDGIHYVSHCLGYARERSILGHNPAPIVVWEDGVFIDADQHD